MGLLLSCWAWAGCRLMIRGVRADCGLESKESLHRHELVLVRVTSHASESGKSRLLAAIAAIWRGEMVPMWNRTGCAALMESYFGRGEPVAELSNR